MTRSRATHANAAGFPTRAGVAGFDILETGSQARSSDDGGGGNRTPRNIHSARRQDSSWRQAMSAGPAGYFTPMTIESGPTRCSARVVLNPASVIQRMQSAAV
jgi:hypothetical protein